MPRCTHVWWSEARQPIRCGPQRQVAAGLWEALGHSDRYCNIGCKLSQTIILGASILHYFTLLFLFLKDVIVVTKLCTSIVYRLFLFCCGQILARSKIPQDLSILRTLACELFRECSNVISLLFIFSISFGGGGG